MTTTPHTNPLGVAIKTLRNTAHLTLADTSKIAGVSPAYLSRVENGIVAPSPEWVHNLTASIGQHLIRPVEHRSSAA